MTLERGRLGVHRTRTSEAELGGGSGVGRGMGGLEFAISSKRGSALGGTGDREAESSGSYGK